MKTETQTPVSKWMTKQQVADYIGTSVFFVETLLKAGRLPASRISYKILRFHQDEVDKALAATSSVAQ
jgi:excisionase family DNA binding protein